MFNRKTVAIIGLSVANIFILATKIAQENAVLLFDHDASVVNKMFLQLRSENPNATVEVMTCPINASWEADIIVLANYYLEQANLIHQIKKVATGKSIVILMAEEEKNKAAEYRDSFQDLFTFSKIICVFVSDKDNHDCFVFEANNEEPLQTNLTFFTTIGLKVIK